MGSLPVKPKIFANRRPSAMLGATLADGGKNTEAPLFCLLGNVCGA
jgi:hypothetical protein